MGFSGQLTITLYCKVLVQSFQNWLYFSSFLGFLNKKHLHGMKDLFPQYIM